MTDITLRYMQGESLDVVYNATDLHGNPLDLSMNAFLTLKVSSVYPSGLVEVDSVSIPKGMDDWTEGVIGINASFSNLDTDIDYFVVLEDESGVRISDGSLTAVSNPYLLKDVPVYMGNGYDPLNPNMPTECGCGEPPEVGGEGSGGLLEQLLDELLED